MFLVLISAQKTMVIKYLLRAGTSRQSLSLCAGWHYEIKGITYHCLSARLIFKNGHNLIKLTSVPDAALHWFLYSCDPPEKAALAVRGGAGERAQRTAPEEAASRDHGSVKHTQKELGVWENVTPTMSGTAGEAAELIQYGKERYIDGYLSESYNKKYPHIHERSTELAIFSLLLFGRLAYVPKLDLTYVSNQEYQCLFMFLFKPWY